MWRNFCKTSFFESPLWGGWRYLTFCHKSAFHAVSFHWSRDTIGYIWWRVYWKRHIPLYGYVWITTSWERQNLWAISKVFPCLVLSIIGLSKLKTSHWLSHPKGCEIHPTHLTQDVLTDSGGQQWCRPWESLDDLSPRTLDHQTAELIAICCYIYVLSTCTVVDIVTTSMVFFS